MSNSRNTEIESTAIDDGSQSEDPLIAVGDWAGVLIVSGLLFAATFNPLLATLLPCLRAAWPALATAFWLRANDDWIMRGSATFHFHVAMAGFRAGVVGVGMMILLAFAAVQFQMQGDFERFMVAGSVVLAGIAFSCLFGCWGAFLAWRHGVRVFVMSDLKARCLGDFARIETLSNEKSQHNPANYVMCITFVTPLLYLWFEAIILTIDDPIQHGPPSGLAITVLVAGPFLMLAGVLLMLFLVRRIIAQSPQDCWGAKQLAAANSDEPYA